MSDLMRRYLQSWLEWAEGAAEEHAPYTRAYGLCANRRGFTRDDTERRLMLDELRDMFRRDGLDPDYPFGEEAYEVLCWEEEQHLYEPRLAWVRSKLAAFQEAA